MNCVNCSKEFIVDKNDNDFCLKMNVPTPTRCPRCRMVRRFVWRNEHALYKKADDNTKKLVFSAYPPQSKIKIFDHDYWWSDAWDPVSFGREYDFSTTFLAQFKDLLLSVPLCSRSIKSCINSDYCNNISNLKNAYLCFSGTNGENVAYGFCFSGSNDCVDFYQTKDSRLCYETFSIVDCERMFWSSDCANCYNVWFSSNCRNCNDCFGCVNLRNQKYCIFNQQYTKEEYEKRFNELYDGSLGGINNILQKFADFKKDFPVQYIHGNRNKDVTGDYLYACNNTLDSFEVHNVDNARYSQFIRHSKDVYDFTSWGIGSSLIYESVNCGDNSQNIKFCFECWPNCIDLEYCVDCHSCSDCFGCVGLRKKQYCIFNKQYSKEEYYKMRESIITHMNQMPYYDQDDKPYTYGEFFPEDFSPLTYAESSACEYFHEEDLEISNDDASRTKYTIDIEANSIPVTIDSVDELYIDKSLGCMHAGNCNHKCPGAFRITSTEFSFYKRFNIPLPNLCPNCRFAARMKKLNSIFMREGECECKNTSHSHEGKCVNRFFTNYSSDFPQSLFCEDCYKKEVY